MERSLLKHKVATILKSKYKRHLARQNIISKLCTLKRNPRVSWKLFVVDNVNIFLLMQITGIFLAQIIWHGISDAYLFFVNTFSKEENLLSASFWDGPGHIQHHILLAFWGWTHDIFWDVQLLLQPPETLRGVAVPSASSGQPLLKSCHTAGSRPACCLVEGDGVAA